MAGAEGVVVVPNILRLAAAAARLESTSVVSPFGAVTGESFAAEAWAPTA